MQEETNQDNQKTIVAFVVGLLIGGLLVWAFSGPEATTDAPTDDAPEVEITEVTETSNENTSEMNTSFGTGDISIPNQPASASIMIDTAEYPVSEGWIGVRDYTDGELGLILGVNRFSESQGLMPEQIELVRSTQAGSEYAVVIYEEDGDFDFSLAGDTQLETIFDTFTAQ